LERVERKRGFTLSVKSKKNMKTIKIIVTVLAIALSFNTYAQKKAKTIKLEQTPGVFTQKTLELKPGKYVFQVSNKNIDHEVAFALAPKKETIGDGDYIQEAFWLTLFHQENLLNRKK
jgi:hypothetical protein